jgi:hypothetical protein
VPSHGLAAVNAVIFFVEQYLSVWCVGMKIAHQVYRVLRWDKPQDWMFLNAWTKGHTMVFGHGLWVLFANSSIVYIIDQCSLVVL